MLENSEIYPLQVLWAYGARTSLKTAYFVGPAVQKTKIFNLQTEKSSKSSYLMGIFA